jgi:hypothetical protein
MTRMKTKIDSGAHHDKVSVAIALSDGASEEEVVNIGRWSPVIRFLVPVWSFISAITALDRQWTSELSRIHQG